MRPERYGRYRLLVDLTRYDSEFTAGVEGELDGGPPGELDCFAWLTLDSGARLKVLWKGLEKIQ